MLDIIIVIIILVILKIIVIGIPDIKLPFCMARTGRPQVAIKNSKALASLK